MKYSNLNNSGSSGSASGNCCIRCFKNTTLKAFIISLFAFSTIFIIYQLIYYMLLNEYQIEESHHRKFDLFSEGGGGAIKSTQLNSLPDFQDNLVVAVEDQGLHHQKDKGDLGPYPPHVERKKGKPVLSSKILGVKPTDLHLYTDQQASSRTVFRCLSTSKTISWDKVNDDYCDCPLDGSDEPSTSACISGKFYCVRKDGTKGYIPSSRVNDGICDCKDGTDEHTGIVRCKKWLLK